MRVKAKAKMEMTGEVMERGLKKLEVGKRTMYAVSFRNATGAMETVPRRGVYREGGKEKGGENVEKCEEISPLQTTKQFDQTFQKFDAWCESM